MRQMFQPRRLVVIALALFLFIVAPRLKRQLPNLNEREEYLLETNSIEIPERPDWVPSDLVQQVAVRAALPPRISLLEDGWTEEIAEAFRLHPWVRQVDLVQATGPRSVSVSLEYRKPAAMVEVRTGLYPVDGNGVLLPPDDFSIRDTQQYCLIRNVRTTPQGPAGTVWGDTVLEGAAQLAEVLSDKSSDPTQNYWQRLNLVSIYVPRPSASSPAPESLFYELETDRGSRIKWGRAPGIEHPGELSTAQKLGRLERYLAQVDDGSGPYEIDIRHWREITYQPIAEADDPAGTSMR